MTLTFTTDPPIPGRAYKVRAYVRHDTSPTGIRLQEWVPHPIEGDWASAVRRLHAERSFDSEPEIEGGWPKGWYLNVDRLVGVKDHA